MIADWPQLEDSESLPQDLVAGTLYYRTVPCNEVELRNLRFSCSIEVIPLIFILSFSSSTAKYLHFPLSFFLSLSSLSLIRPFSLFLSFALFRFFVVAGFRSFQNLIRSVRNARAEYNVAPAKKIAALVRLSSTSASSSVFTELLKTEGKLTD